MTFSLPSTISYAEVLGEGWCLPSPSERVGRPHPVRTWFRQSQIQVQECNSLSRPEDSVSQHPFPASAGYILFGLSLCS